MVPSRSPVIFIGHEGASTGAWNMARDLELHDAVRRGDLDLAFRTYQWEPWAISLGKNQTTEAIDVVEAQRRGFDVVHRPTGGRAVLHANEITYCIAIKGHPRDIYSRVHSALYQALEPFAPGTLSFEGKPTDLRQHYAAGTPTGQVCFTSSAKTEIMSNGRKLVGSAQRVIDGVVLQHGSILVDKGHEQIADLLFLSEHDNSAFQARLASASTTLVDLRGGIPVSYEDVVASILRSIRSFFLV